MSGLSSDAKSRANAVQEGFNNQVRQIRANADLTREAKQRQIDEAYETASGRLAQIREEWKGGTQNSADSLTRRVFGAPAASATDAISLRDALDRVSRLESARDAADLLRRATQSGDEVLARAVAQHAFDQRSDFFTGREWTDVVDTFAAGRPELAEPINQLHSLTSSAGMTADFNDEANFVIFKPDQI